MPEATTHTWQQGIRRRATIGDVCSAGSPQAAPKGLSEQLAPLEGVLHKQHRASKVLAWGKRYFRVDDLREALCYYRTEAQFERQDPVLRLPLRNLAAVRRLQQPPLEFLFELRLFSPVAVAGWAGRSCGNTGQQRPAIAADDDDNEYAYEVSDKQAPRSFIVRADTEAEAEAWVGGLQARIARRWHRPASARAPTPPLDPNIEEVCRALGAALSLDDHRCGGGTRPLTPPAAPPPVPPATPRDSARQRDLGQDRVLGQDRDADVVPALDLQRRSWRRTSAEARRAPPGPSHPYALTPMSPHCQALHTTEGFLTLMGATPRPLAGAEEAAYEAATQAAKQAAAAAAGREAAQRMASSTAAAAAAATGSARHAAHLAGLAAARGYQREVLVVQDIKDVTVQDEVLVVQDDLGISDASSDGGQSRSPPPRRWLQEAPRTPR